MNFLELESYLDKVKNLSFTGLQKEIHSIAKDKGFWDEPRNNGELIALIHSELSECLEEFRKSQPNNGLIAEELADALIRILDMAEGLNLNLHKAVVEKMAVNKSRPHKHGKQF